MSSGILMEMTLDEVRAFAPETVVIGIGSVEPHGPALPYGTDAFLGERITRDAVLAANRDGARALMYPTLPVGNNVNFKAFPFACRIGVTTLMRVMLDIFAALEEDGIRKIVVVNAHGGNTDTLRAALRAHVDATPPARRAFVCMPDLLTADGITGTYCDHAGRIETSRLWHVREDLLRQDKIGQSPVGEPTVAALAGHGIFYVRPWHAFLPRASEGDAREASRECGRQQVEAATTALVALLKELAQAPWHENFPYTKCESGRT
jgi:creatinine amidohydrolase